MHFELIDAAISLCLLLGAVLYTSVGHAGASIYIAIMTLFNIPCDVINPTALVMNIFIASFSIIDPKPLPRCCGWTTASTLGPATRSVVSRWA